MRFGVPALVASVLVALGAIVALIALPDAGDGAAIVDRRTGEILVHAENQALHALRSGDTPGALATILSWPPIAREEENVARLAATLELELEPPPALPEDHPLTRGPVDDTDELLSSLHAVLGDAMHDRAIEAWFERSLALAAADQLVGLDHRAALLLREVRASEDPSELTDRMLAMADAFSKVGRVRARNRWLLRALRSEPEEAGLRLELARAFVADGRLCEAAATLHGVEPEETLAAPYWRENARIQRWLDRRQAERGALERLQAIEPAAQTVDRIAALYRADGDVAGAAAVHLDAARTRGDAEAILEAVDGVLAAGLLEPAIDELERLALVPATATCARRLLASVLEQNLRFEEAIAVRTELAQATRDREDLEALATVLRRRHRLRDLVALLRAHPELALDTAEPIDLLCALGDTEGARDLLHAWAGDARSGSRFFDLLPRFLDADLERLPELAGAAAAHVAAGDLGSVLDAMPIDDAVWVRWNPDPALQALRQRFEDARELVAFRADRIAHLPDPKRALARAQVLARDHPDHLEAARAWVDAADRAGSVTDTIAARQRVRTLAPTDMGNLAGLAWALESAGEREAAAPIWLELQTSEDPEVRSALFELFARNGELDGIEGLLAGRGDDADALARAARQLFEHGHHEAARRYYERVLALAPRDLDANLHTGLIHSWRNEPRAAVPFLETAWSILRDEAPAEADDTATRRVAYHLAEALWAAGQRDRALMHYSFALAAEAVPNDDEGYLRRARALHRVGRVDEAASAFEYFLDGNPGHRVALLELAELQLESGMHDPLAETLQVLDAAFGPEPQPGPEHKRWIRVSAQAALARAEFTRAESLLRDGLRRYPTDGSELADLGRAQEGTGALRDALTTYQRWQILQDNRDSGAAAQRVRDVLAHHVGLQQSFLIVGDDLAYEAGVYAATTLDRERTRLYGRLGWASFSGRSPAVAAGTVDVETSTARIDVAIAHRYGGDRDQIGAGLRFHPGATGDRDVGAWIEHHYEGKGPRWWSLSARLGFDELWTQPAAAPGLTGRRSGLDLESFVAIGRRGWVSADLGYHKLGARAPLQPREHDDRLYAGFQAGWRWTDGEIATTDPFRAHRAPAGPISAYAGHGPTTTGDLHASTWVGMSVQSFRGDEALTTILPLDDEIRFLYAAGRLDGRWREGLGWSVDGLVGSDFDGGNSAWEAAVAGTWRPHRGGTKAWDFEIFGRLGAGDAIGRAGFDSQTLFGRLEGVVRW